MPSPLSVFMPRTTPSELILSQSSSGGCHFLRGFGVAGCFCSVCTIFHSCICATTVAMISCGAAIRFPSLASLRANQRPYVACIIASLSSPEALENQFRSQLARALWLVFGLPSDSCCHAQYAILSERNSKVPPKIEPHIETLLQGGYHYIVPLHNSWGYIQQAYNATRIHQHHTQEQHLTTDETQTKTQTTSTLLAQAADLEPIPRSKKKQKRTPKQASVALA